MKKEELSIGNTVEQGIVYEIRNTVARIKYNDRYSLIAYEDLKPVPLTEEILLKCSGIKKEHSKIFTKKYFLNLKRNKYLIISDIDTPNFMIGMCDIEEDGTIEDLVNIWNWDYEKEIPLHVFQNIYNIHSQKKLEINL